MSKTSDVDLNPHNLCTWNDEADCENCLDKNLLFCKFDKKTLTAFLFLFLPFFAISFFALVVVGVLTGIWWLLIAYGALYLAVFGFIETGILCRHCPYYARTGTNLKCIADCGCFRIWKYNPEPIKSWERAVMYGYYTIMTGLPVIGTAYGIWYVATHTQEYSNIALLGMIGLELSIVVSVITFLVCLSIYVCSRCVNFSCLFNTVEKPVVY